MAITLDREEIFYFAGVLEQASFEDSPPKISVESKNERLLARLQQKLGFGPIKRRKKDKDIGKVEIEETGAIEIMKVIKDAVSDPKKEEIENVLSDEKEKEPSTEEENGPKYDVEKIKKAKQKIRQGKSPFVIADQFDMEIGFVMDLGKGKIWKHL